MSRPSLSITYVGTSTVILSIGDVNLLLDPSFSPAGKTYDLDGFILRKTLDPAIQPADLLTIDGILITNESFPVSLDEPGREILGYKPIITTMDGLQNLRGREHPLVQGVTPGGRETWKVKQDGPDFQVTGAPVSYGPGPQRTGFVITREDFGVDDRGRPNAIYISGATADFAPLAPFLSNWNVVVAVLYFGKEMLPGPQGGVQCSLDGKMGTELFKASGAEVLVPVHFEGWEHFKEGKDELKKALEADGVAKSVQWLEPGKAVKVGKW